MPMGEFLAAYVGALLVSERDERAAKEEDKPTKTRDGKPILENGPAALSMLKGLGLKVK